MDLQARSATPLRLVLDKLVWRLRYIKKLLPAPVHRKIQLVWPLAFASVFWCAGVAAPNSSVLDSIQTETLNVFTSSFTHEVPAFLKHVLLGWHISPQFLQDFTALRRAALFETLRPLWLEDAPSLRKPHLGWHCSLKHEMFCSDTAGLRSRMSRDSPRLMLWVAGVTFTSATPAYECYANGLKKLSSARVCTSVGVLGTVFKGPTLRVLGV